MKILIVDDETSAKESLSIFFSSCGHHVFECNNGTDALELLRKEQIHLVLSDIRMPQMDGYELLKQIKKSRRFKDTVVVLITGYGDIKSAVEAMKDGAYDYLLKPLNVYELSLITDRAAEYLMLKQENKQLTKNFEEHVDEATKDIQMELENLKKAYARETGIPEIGLFSKKMRKVFKIAKKLHRNRNIPALITGETGTGKEIVARYIHFGDNKIANPFVDMNCAAISPNLFESELFGYEAGAFTGGKPKGQKGKLELAEGGTIFLDEISEIPNEYQAKFLRIIQERKYYRVGGLKKYSTDVRFICATNQDIKSKVSDGSFREDLYYRINVGHIHVPPLQERREEIVPLAQMFLKQLYERNITRFSKISPEACKILEENQWPGNVRELKNTMEKIAILYDGREIKPNHLDFIQQDSLQSKFEKSLPKEYSLNDFIFPEEGMDLNKFILSIVSKA